MTTGPRFDRLVGSLLAGGLLTLLLYTPTFQRTGVGSVVSNSFVKARPFEDFRRELPGSLALVWDQWNLDIPRPIAFCLVVLWIIAFFLPSPRRSGVRSITGLFMTLLATTLAVVCYQRVIPFDRVWLFLAPVYLGMVATGLSAISGAWLRPPKRWDFSIAVMIAIGLAGCVWHSPSIPEESSKLTVNHGRRLVRRIAAEIQPGDAVITELPCDGPLRYYLMADNLPIDLLYDYRVAQARRLFVVVNRPNGQSIRSVLEANHLAHLVTKTAILIEDFGRSALFIIRVQ